MIAFLQGKVEEVQEKMAEIKAKDRQLHDQQAQLRAKDDMMVSLKQEQAAELQRIQARCADEQTEVKALTAKIREMTQLSAETQAQLSVQTEEYREAKAHIEKFKAQAGDLTADIGRLTSENINSQAEISSLKERLGDMARRNDELQYTETALEGAKTALVDKCAEFDQFKQHAHLQIKGLEEELRKAAEVTESLDRLRMDEKRIHEAIVLDLTEKLNFACTAKRSLERYVHYVKTTYRDVFHRPIAVPII